MQRFEHFGEIVRYIEKTQDNPTAFNVLKGDYWQPTSTKEFIYDLKRLVYGLLALGLKKGDKIGILSTPSTNWMIADLAIIISGGISVPLFAKISDENFVYEVAQANIRFLFVSGREQWAKFIRHESLFETVIGLNGIEEPDGVMPFHEMLKLGENLWQEKPALFDELLFALKGDDLATIVYTSGSTGAPKGAELTHKNLIHLITQDVFHWVPNEKYLSILPLAHIFARQIVYIMMAWGVSIYFLSDLGKFAESCKEVKPELMIVVPRLLEKLHDKIMSGLRKGGRVKQAIGMWAANLAKKKNKNLIQRLILHPIANLLVYRKIRNAFGDRFRIILCGGAKLDTELYRFFLSLGFPVYEGWGLTEGSTACVNRPGMVEVGTVGPPLPGIQIKIGANDEVLVGGPTVMRGYYRYPKATRMAIDEEGWLHTGDKGRIDSKGFLTIIGRIKEQFKLSTGEYVAPSRIEHILTHASPLIDAALVVGDGKPFASCLIFPDKEVLLKLKEENGTKAMSDADFLQTEIVKKEIRQALEVANSRINKFEKVLAYRLIQETPSIEAGELTPTLKIKRNVVQEKYKHIIEAIYLEEPS